MRSPGRMLEIEEPPFSPVLSFVAAQLKGPLDIWAEYGQRAETRRAHLVELQSVFGLTPFTVRCHKSSVQALAPLALQTAKRIMLAKALIEALRSRGILLPSILMIERICAQAMTRGNRPLYPALTAGLTQAHRQKLEHLLNLHEHSKNQPIALAPSLPQSPNAPPPWTNSDGPKK